MMRGEIGRPSDALARGTAGGTSRLRGVYGQAVCDRPCVPWTLLAREAEGRLGQPAEQAVVSDLLQCITSTPVHGAANSTHDFVRSAPKGWLVLHHGYEQLLLMYQGFRATSAENR